MLVYLCPIGSGKVLNHIHGSNEYCGILGIIEKSPQFGLFYQNNKIDQKEVFDNKFIGSSYKIQETIVVDTNSSLYSISSKILDKMDEIISNDSNVKFHIETSAGYKSIGQILILISSFRSKNISKATFSDINMGQIEFPVNEIKLTNTEKKLLKEYFNNCDSNWNGKIISNNFVRNYKGNKKFLYRVYSKCRKLGLMDEKNKVTDLGKLYVDYC